MLWVAVDDTDSREGGCTTFLARRIVEVFPERRLAGAPRLVRLNPAVPWKTRGNGALAVPLSGPAGDAELLESYRRVAAVVEEHARLDGTETRPGWAVSPGPVDPTFYARAVRSIVGLDEATDALSRAGAVFGGLRGARGLIGCAGALAWRAGPSRAPRSEAPGVGSAGSGPNEATSVHTACGAGGSPSGVGTFVSWEWIAYRSATRVGTKREIDPDSVRMLEARFPATFDSYDPWEGEVVMVPASPCPVLFGVRAVDPAAAARAAACVRGERAAESTLFLTNHGSDDHLVPGPLGGWASATSQATRVRVAGEPESRGGHVFLPVEADGCEAMVAAYAPTGRLRESVRALRPGDAIVACGQVASPGHLNLEKFGVLSRRPRRALDGGTSRPSCPRCGGPFRSAGRGVPRRCRRCHLRAPASDALPSYSPAEIAAGAAAQSAADSATQATSTGGGVEWREATPSARRHLARPLRFGAPRVFG